jgi:hypothetical protein
LITAALVGAVGPLAGQQEASASQELRELYEADQADRRFSSPPTPEQWAEVSARDRERQARVHELLRSDRLAAADDFYHAAMVLQHGEGSEDILLAHILAAAAGFRGHEKAQWLSAAALDRYLHRTEQPQRLGTQYVRVRPDEPYRLDPDAPWSQGASTRTLRGARERTSGGSPIRSGKRSVSSRSPSRRRTSIG